MICFANVVCLCVQANHTPFLCSLADLGSQLGQAPLRDAARDLLRLLPAEQSVVTALRAALATAPTMERFFQTSSPSVNLYQLEVCLALLLPATNQPTMAETTQSTQVVTGYRTHTYFTCRYLGVR